MAWRTYSKTEIKKTNNWANKIVCQSIKILNIINILEIIAFNEKISWSPTLTIFHCLKIINLLRVFSDLLRELETSGLSEYEIFLTCEKASV